MANLTKLTFELEGFPGTTLPSCLACLNHLTVVSLFSNLGGWSSSISSVQWSNLTSLTSLSLIGQSLTGPLPALLPASLTTLQFSMINGRDSNATAAPLHLSNVSWRNNPSLINIVLNYNNYLLMGSTPWMAFPTGLQSFQILANANQEFVSMSVFQWSTYTSLRTLTINGMLNGPIPTTFTNLTYVTSIDLSNNNLTGSVAAANWSSMPSLQTLRLDGNRLDIWDHAFNAGPASLQLLSATQSSSTLNGSFDTFLLSLNNFTSL